MKFRKIVIATLILVVIKITTITDAQNNETPNYEIAISAFDEGDFDIFLVNVETGEQRNVSNLHGDEHNPSWSADGQTLAYYCKPDEQDGICVIDMQSEQMSFFAIYHVYFEISPNGDELVTFSAGGVTITNIETGEFESQATMPLWFNWLRYSPDGNWRIHSYTDNDIISQNHAFLTRTNDNFTYFLSNYFDGWSLPSWTSDSRYIVYTATTEEPDNVAWQASDIFLLDTDNLRSTDYAPINLTQSDTSESRPVISADGKYVAFVSERNQDDWFEVYIINVETNEESFLIDGVYIPIEYVYPIAWRPFIQSES